MDGASAPSRRSGSGSANATPAGPVLARQRWRLTFARSQDPERRTHREIVDSWLSRLGRSGLPLLEPSGRQRSPLTFAAPLPAGMECRRELADLWLTAVLPAWSVRAALRTSLPDKVALENVDDVWVGAPALAAALRAADYRVELIPPVPIDAIEGAAEQFRGAPSIERERVRGAGTVRQNIRPLIGDLRVERDPPALVIQALFHPERGAGRPEDVIAALEELMGASLERRETIRERLVIAD